MLPLEGSYLAMISGKTVPRDLAIVYSSYALPMARIINGVKEMCGFRMTFNLSYSSAGVNESCSLASCSENISESTILVGISV